MFIHAGLVSLHSKPLDRMINGPMVEVQKGFAVLEDTDEGTFVRFIEWAYKGYYTAADVHVVTNSGSSQGSDRAESIVSEPKMENAADGPVTESVEQDARSPPSPVQGYTESPSGDDWSYPREEGQQVKKTKSAVTPSAYELSLDTKSSKETLRELFICRENSVRQESIAIPPPRPNQSPEEDYTNVFLSHASLHVFAEKYDIQTLKSLALENLQNTLAIFTLYSERTGDIIELLRYVYGCVRKIPEMEDLRMLVTNYLGYEMDILMEDEAFKDLLVKDGGTLLGDFMDMVWKRI